MEINDLVDLASLEGEPRAFENCNICGDLVLRVVIFTVFPNLWWRYLEVFLFFRIFFFGGINLIREVELILM